MAHTFRSIDELIRVLHREQVLLKEMFTKRKSFSFRYDYACELLEYREDRIRFLINSDVIRENGNFLEMEDVYLNFFEEVLEVNEEINVSSISEYIERLNDNIDYYLKESNERRKYGYLKEVRRALTTISLTTVRNVVDLKRNVDNTYKNEPNYNIKKAKLKKLDEKRNAIARLIVDCEDVIDHKQQTFFSVAMDVQMRDIVNGVKSQLNESYHNLIEIDRQIINYLNMIDYQNRLLKKIHQLKYLRDQVTIEENTDIRSRMQTMNPVWIEPQAGYRLKLSIDNLRNSDDALEILKDVIVRKKGARVARNLGEAITGDYLNQETRAIEVVNQYEIKNAFIAQSDNLYHFVQNYNYRKQMTREDRLVLFCQIASQFIEEMRVTNETSADDDITYPIILPD